MVVATQACPRACWIATRSIPPRYSCEAMGASALEGYPVDPGSERVDQTSGYVGTVSLFEAHGFSRVCHTAGHRGGKPRWLVRCELP
jgi:hypothetical protein